MFTLVIVTQNTTSELSEYQSNYHQTENKDVNCIRALSTNILNIVLTYLVACCLVVETEAL